MPSKEELKKLSKTRLKEVKVLFRNGLYDGAAYLAGYAIETALKARICKILNSDYPESGDISRSFLTHKLDNLVKLGGLEKALNIELANNIQFKVNWSLATAWSETLRYKPIGSNSKDNLNNLITALEDGNNGVLTWIKKRW